MRGMHSDIQTYIMDPRIQDNIFFDGVYSCPIFVAYLPASQAVKYVQKNS